MRDFLVVDFEFTMYTKRVGRPRGFFSEILEYGLVKLDGRQHTVITEAQAFVKPSFFPKQAKQAQEFSMITKADLDKGIKYEEMLEELKTVYEPNNNYFVAWGDADWHVIKEACQRYGLENPIQYADYVDLSREYQNFFNAERRLSLKNALDAQKIELAGTWHTALNDARNTAKLVAHMLKLGWEKSQQEE